MECEIICQNLTFSGLTENTTQPFNSSYNVNSPILPGI